MKTYEQMFHAAVEDRTNLTKEIEALKAEVTDHQFQNDCRSGSEVCACSEKNGYPCYRHIDHEYRKLFALNTATIDRAEKAEAERDRFLEDYQTALQDGLVTAGALEDVISERDRYKRFIQATTGMIEIPNHPHHYVTADGDVYGALFRNNRTEFIRSEPLKFNHVVDKYGYAKVHVQKKCYLVHRLVLLSFRGECPEGMEGSHIDGNPLNNHISNLVWETKKENHARKEGHGTSHKGSGNQNSKLTEAQVLEIRRLGDTGVAKGVIAGQFDLSHQYVSSLVTRKAWKHLPEALNHKATGE